MTPGLVGRVRCMQGAGDRALSVSRGVHSAIQRGSQNGHHARRFGRKITALAMAWEMYHTGQEPEESIMRTYLPNLLVLLLGIVVVVTLSGCIMVVPAYNDERVVYEPAPPPPPHPPHPHPHPQPGPGVPFPPPPPPPPPARPGDQHHDRGPSHESPRRESGNRRDEAPAPAPSPAPTDPGSRPPGRTR